MTVSRSYSSETLPSTTALPPNLLEQVIAALSVGAVVWRLDNPLDERSLRLLYYNEAARKSSPVRWPEIIGRSIGEVMPQMIGTSLSGVACGLALHGGVAELGDVKLHEVSGDEIFSLRAVGLQDRCVLMTFTNVSVERLLMQDAERFFHQMSTPMCVAGLTGHFKRLNQAFLLLLGHREHEPLEAPILDYVHPEDQALVCEALQELQVGAPNVSYEARLRTSAGTYCRLAFTITACQDELYCTAYDVTSLRQIETELRSTTTELGIAVAEARDLAETRAELLLALENNFAVIHQQQGALTRAEKLAAIGQLAASVAHELRNPLAAVRNATTYLSRQLLDPTRRARASTDPKIPKFFELIERELNMTGKIISDLLDFARERELVLQPCPVAPLVDEAMGLVLAGRVHLENQVLATMPMPVIDREQMRQVFVNLAQNAVDSIPPDRPGEVIFTASGGEQSPWRITISDNGIGIPAELQAKIFEPLYTTKIKGTGLGLAIVQGIIKRHGGRMEVQSKVGQGTVMTMILPCLPQNRDKEMLSS